MTLKQFLKVTKCDVEVCVMELGHCMEFSTKLRNGEVNIHISDKHLNRRVYHVDAFNEHLYVRIW